MSLKDIVRNLPWVGQDQSGLERPERKKQESVEPKGEREFSKQSFLGGSKRETPNGKRKTTEMASTGPTRELNRACSQCARAPLHYSGFCRRSWQSGYQNFSQLAPHLRMGVIRAFIPGNGVPPPSPLHGSSRPCMDRIQYLSYASCRVASRRVRIKIVAVAGANDSFSEKFDPLGQISDVHSPRRCLRSLELRMACNVRHREALLLHSLR